MSSAHKPVVLQSIAKWLLVLPLLAMGTAFFATKAVGQSYTWNNVVTNGGGGYIPNIIFNPSQPNLIYARTDIGGAYRWNPTTSHWVPLMDWVGFDDWNTLGVESIATDPVNPQRVYVAAGTYTNSFTTANGAILSSTDQGNTWQRTNLPFKLGGNMPARNMGERMAVDPNNDSIIYLGTRSGNGLWKSTDFGVTWAKVTSFPQPGTYIITPGDAYLGDIVGVAWVTFDPRSATPGNTTQTIYVGVAQPFGTNIYRSTNGGTTWAAVPGQPTCTLTGSNVACSDGASWTIGSTSPNHPGSGLLPQHGKLSPNGFLYVTYSDGAGPYDGTIGDVWKLNTATGAWTQIAPVLPTDTADDYYGYGGLAIDTMNPNTIMVSALNSWWPDTIIFRSLDAGATWTRIWDWTSYPSRSLRYIQDISAAPWLNFGNTNPVPPVPSPLLGWMVSGLEIDPFNSNHILYGTGATLYGSNDLTTWDTGGQIHISVAAQGIEEAAVLDLISPPVGAHLYSALGDIGGFRHDDLTTSPAAMYSVPFAGTNVSIDYAELSPAFICRVGNGNATASPPIRSTAFSFDSGSDWFQGNNDPPGYTNGGGGTIAAAADASRVVWNPSGLGAFFSTDNGNSWTASTGLPAGGRVASDRVNPMKFYDFVNGTFYVSTNGGASFTASAATGLPPAGTSVRFKAVPGHEGDIWLAGGSDTSGVYGLWHSTNSGATFTKLANVDKADNIGFGMPAPGQTYVALYSSAQVGGVRGIFRSDDAGATWIRINDDQHQYGSTGAAITGDPRIYGRVYFSTNGRGIIYGDINSTTPDFSLAASPTSLTVNRGASGTSTITIARLNSFAGAVAFTASGLPTGVTASFSPATTTTTGTSSVLTLTASSTATLGAATITVTGTSGTLTHTASIALTVASPPTPDFSLAASPTSLTVTQGTSGTSTITITRLNSFAGAVSFTASGLPTGVTASFNPATTTTTGTSSVLTLTASSTATVGAATVTVTGTSGTLTHSATITLTVAATPTPDFSLSASPTSLTVNRGASGTSTITITRLNSFAGAVAFTASGLPTGVTASFNPATTTTTGTSSVLTLTASSTATLGTATVTVTGTSGTLTHTTSIALTVATAPTPDFSLAASPTSLTVNQGASGTSTITITRLNSFASAVSFTASGLPTGVTASFNPATTTTTGTSSVLTLTASATATTGAATVTVTGTSGTLTHTATIALTVAPTGGGTGGVTVTPVVSSSSPYFNEEDIKLANTASLTALSVTIVVQRTTGISFSGQYNTVGGQITQGNSSTTSAVTYTFALGSGQTLGPSTNYTFAAQTSGTGTAHPTTGDTYTVTYTTGGQSFTQTGHF
jgi:xyloglucan-specific exo-beta-1,4-glucanase